MTEKTQADKAEILASVNRALTSASERLEDATPEVFEEVEDSYFEAKRLIARAGQIVATELENPN